MTYYYMLELSVRLLTNNIYICMHKSVHIGDETLHSGMDYSLFCEPSRNYRGVRHLLVHFHDHHGLMRRDSILRVSCVSSVKLKGVMPRREVTISLLLRFIFSFGVDRNTM